MYTKTQITWPFSSKRFLPNNFVISYLTKNYNKNKIVWPSVYQDPIYLAL